MLPRWLMAETKRPINDKRLVRISKSLSWLLRHGAEERGLPMRKDGYVCVQDLLRQPRLSGVTLLTLEELVRRDKKQRYHLLHQPQNPVTSSDPAFWWIRANQGHSLQNVEVELTRVLSADQLPMAVHGTTLKAWKSIARLGISRMSRIHIHLAQGVPGANITSGIRSSAQVLIFIDLEKAMGAGIKFYLSSNGVVLTEGNDLGFLEPCFFQHVEFVKIKADQLMGPVEEEQCATDALSSPAASGDVDSPGLVSIVKGLTPSHAL